MKTEILKGYEDAADGDYIERLEGISTSDLLEPVMRHIPKVPSRVLDVGAGTGRDAAWFASLSHTVMAAEPVDVLRRAGMSAHPSPSISWVADSLPMLSRVVSGGHTFDLVLLCAVWQHLDADDRRRALGTLNSLVESGGKIIMSIRDGPGAPTRPVFPAQVNDTVAWAKALGLSIIDEIAACSVQPENRKSGVVWTWLVLQRR